mmetsp:Transcript_9157/g.26403  ORF Transcript_9157/g.26403 Transcript_9157/m.26403 type:complete len:225 (+) Transcript_9157:339-1013(+)
MTRCTSPLGTNAKPGPSAAPGLLMGLLPWGVVAAGSCDPWLGSRDRSLPLEGSPPRARDEEGPAGAGLEREEENEGGSCTARHIRPASSPPPGSPPPAPAPAPAVAAGTITNVSMALSGSPSKCLSPSGSVHTTRERPFMPRICRWPRPPRRPPRHPPRDPPTSDSVAGNRCSGSRPGPRQSSASNGLLAGPPLAEGVGGRLGLCGLLLARTGPGRKGDWNSCS